MYVYVHHNIIDMLSTVTADLNLEKNVGTYAKTCYTCTFAVEAFYSYRPLKLP